MTDEEQKLLMDFASRYAINIQVEHKTRSLDFGAMYSSKTLYEGSIVKMEIDYNRMQLLVTREAAGRSALLEQTKRSKNATVQKAYDHYLTLLNLVND